MKNESKIVELLSEMLHKFDILTGRVDFLPERLDNQTDVVDRRFGRVEGRLEKVEGEIVKLNLITSENSLALMKLGDMNDRVVRLERAVFK